MKYLLIKRNTKLFIAESHYFNEEGKRELSLTDKEDYAERFEMPEVNLFLQSYPNEYDIIEDISKNEGDEE